MIEIKNIRYPKVGAEILFFLLEQREAFSGEIVSWIYQKLEMIWGDSLVIIPYTLNQLKWQGLIESVDYNTGIEGYDSSQNLKYSITEKGRHFIEEERQKADETKRIIEEEKRR